MPVSAGIASSNCIIASSPPAEAPIATTGTEDCAVLPGLVAAEAGRRSAFPACKTFPTSPSPPV
jgi:hypothetical protein